MERLKIKVCKQNIVVDRQYLVSDTRNVYQCIFDFSSDWNDYQKWAVFKQDERVFKVLLENNTCIMPAEAVANKGYMYIGVYGLQGTTRYPTIWTNPLLVQLGCIDGIYPPVPTPSEWEQALEYMAKIDLFSLLIPETASEQNKLVDSNTFNTEINRIGLELETIEDSIVTDYPDLNDLPKINGYTLIGNQSGTDIKVVDSDNRLTNTQIEELFRR